MTRPTEDKYLITAEELKNRMVVLLAGRAAEDLVYGTISTGAADDLAKTTDIARQMVTTFGMSPELGQAVLEKARTSYLGPAGVGVQPRDYAEQTAREVDLAVRQLIDDSYQRARELLSEGREVLEQGVLLLLEKETITPDDFPPLLPAQAHGPTAELPTPSGDLPLRSPASGTIAPGQPASGNTPPASSPSGTASGDTAPAGPAQQPATGVGSP